MTSPGREHERTKSSSDVARDRAAFRDAVPAIVTLLVVQGSLVVLDPDDGSRVRNVVWSLLPLLPVLWLVYAQLRSLRRSDEYQRIVQLEAMAIGFATVIVAALVGGLLDAAGIGDARQSLQITFIAGIVSWIAALAIKTRRAR